LECSKSKRHYQLWSISTAKENKLWSTNRSRIKINQKLERDRVVNLTFKKTKNRMKNKKKYWLRECLLPEFSSLMPGSKQWMKRPKTKQKIIKLKKLTNSKKYKIQSLWLMKYSTRLMQRTLVSNCTLWLMRQLSSLNGF
jgi:hypothetical protein